MSTIKRDFQFQILLLHGTYRTAFNTYWDVIPYASCVDYDGGDDVAYSAAYNAAYYGAFNAVVNTAFDTAYNVAFKAALDIAKNEMDLDAKVLAIFKEILKLDSNIQKDIKDNVMTPKGEIPVDYMPTTPKSELQFVRSLLSVDTSK